MSASDNDGRSATPGRRSFSVYAADNLFAALALLVAGASFLFPIWRPAEPIRYTDGSPLVVLEQERLIYGASAAFPSLLAGGFLDIDALDEIGLSPAEVDAVVLEVTLLWVNPGTRISVSKGGTVPPDSSLTSGIGGEFTLNAPALFFVKTSDSGKIRITNSGGTPAEGTPENLPNYLLDEVVVTLVGYVPR